MGENWSDRGGARVGTVEDLSSLQRAQDELWAKLRREVDPDRRMALLSAFGENRAEIERLTEVLGASGRSVVERPLAYRVELIDDEPVDGDGLVGGDEPVDGDGLVGGDEPVDGDGLVRVDEPVDGDGLVRVDEPSFEDDAGPLTFDAAGNLVPATGLARSHASSLDVERSAPGLPDPAGPWPSSNGDDLVDPTSSLPAGLSPDHPDEEPPPPSDGTASPFLHEDEPTIDADDLGVFGRPAATSKVPGGTDDRPPARQRSLPADREPPGPAGGTDRRSGSSTRRRPPSRSREVSGPRNVAADAPQRRQPPPPPSPVRRRQPARTHQMPVVGNGQGSGASPDSARRALLVLGGLGVVLAMAWFLLGRSSDDATTNVASEEAVGLEEDPAPPSTDSTIGEPVEATPPQANPTVDPGRAAMLQEELNRVVASTPIIFDVGQTELSELHARILNSVASTLRAYPDFQVTIVGFADGSGSVEGNRQLSLQRAESVKAYLVGLGVPDGSLQVAARGEDTASGSDALANLERRVEFEVVVPTGAEQAAAAADPIRVAIIAPSASNDLAFTQSMVDATNVLAVERGNVEVAVTDSTFVPDEAAAAIRGYADAGYDLVIAHGSQFGSLLLEIAPEYPDVAFAWGTANDTFGLPNVTAYDAASHQGGYVLGSMSTLLSGTGVVGVIGPIEVGDAKLYVEGFSAGARASKPDATVLVDYTGSFSDLALAAETARNQVGGGADVLTGSAQMVVGAVSVVQESGAVWFGTQSNQASLAPSQVAASQVYHWEVILEQIIADMEAGTLGGRSYTADLANGGLVIEYNPDYPLPPDVRAKADEVIAGIVAGTIQVPVG